MNSGKSFVGKSDLEKVINVKSFSFMTTYSQKKKWAVCILGQKLVEILEVIFLIPIYDLHILYINNVCITIIGY